MSGCVQETGERPQMSSRTKYRLEVEISAYD